MAMLTDTAMRGYKEYTRAEIAYAKYKVGNTYHQTPITSKEYLADGRLAVKSGEHCPGGCKCRGFIPLHI